MSVYILWRNRVIKTLYLYKLSIPSNSLVPLRIFLKGRAFSTRQMNLDTKEPADSNETKGLLIKDIVKKLEAWAPLYLAGSWDKVGLQVEPSGQLNRVSRLLLTNDLTETVVEEAVERGGIGMIISYHPPIFQPLKTLTNRTWKERVITACLENKIAVYSPHTAWDAVNGGINDWLASAFDSSSVKPLTVSKTWSHPGSSETNVTHILEIVVCDSRSIQVDELVKYAEDIGAQLQHVVNSKEGNVIITFGCDGNSLPSFMEFVQSSLPNDGVIRMKVSKCEQIPLPGYGEGRFCALKKPLPLKKIVDIVKHHLKLENIRLAVACRSNIDSLVHTLALCAGSGSSVLSGVKADVLLTGEMGHHDVLEANHRGSHVILCEHSNTERGFLRSLVDKGFLHKILEEAVEVLMSSKDQEPLQIL